MILCGLQERLKHWRRIVMRQAGHRTDKRITNRH
jgi:hypothetical protein